MRMNKITILTNILAIITLIFVCLLWKNNTILTITLAILAISIIAIDKKKLSLKIFLLGAVAGPFAEIIAILSGAWSYTNPNIINIPTWLPILWGIASVYISRTYTSLK